MAIHSSFSQDESPLLLLLAGSPPGQSLTELLERSARSSSFSRTSYAASLPDLSSPPSPLLLSSPIAPATPDSAATDLDDLYLEPTKLQLQEPAETQAAEPAEVEVLDDDISPRDAQSRYPLNASLFVANLAKDRTNDQLSHALHHLFDQYGHCWVLPFRDQAKSNIPYAFVQFRTFGEAEAAFDGSGGQMIYGRPCRIERAKGHGALCLTRNDNQQPNRLEVLGIFGGYTMSVCRELTPAEQEHYHVGNGLYIKLTYYGDHAEVLRSFRQDVTYHVCNLNEPRDPPNPVNPHTPRLGRSKRGRGNNARNRGNNQNHNAANHIQAAPGHGPPNGNLPAEFHHPQFDAYPQNMGPAQPGHQGQHDFGMPQGGPFVHAQNNFYMANDMYHPPQFPFHGAYFVGGCNGMMCPCYHPGHAPFYNGYNGPFYNGPFDMDYPMHQQYANNGPHMNYPPPEFYPHAPFNGPFGFPNQFHPIAPPFYPAELPVAHGGHIFNQMDEPVANDMHEPIDNQVGDIANVEGVDGTIDDNANP